MYVNFRDSLQAVITALYCKILVILGLAFPMAEVISENVPKGYYQLFYVYLFMGSLIYLFTVYVDLLKTRAKRPKKSHIPDDDQLDSPKKNISDHNYTRPRVHYGSFYLRLGAVCKY